VRRFTQAIVGVISLGVLATSCSLGQTAETGLNLASPTPQPTDTTPGSPTPSTTSSANPSSTATQTPTPIPTKTVAPVIPAAKITKTSDPISYIANRSQGVMQISVTKIGTKITAVTIISGGTESADWASVPAVLAKAAVDAQGADFGNIGGATHTTDAFKTALGSALAKF
jgi:uncharacterized protein with FMN-binding domain